jgi:quercetin dioxygenase-like cupin family protein
MKRTTSGIAAIAFIAGTAVTSTLTAQQAPAIKRTIILKQDMTVGGREAVMAQVELPPGSTEGRHTHPAEVYAFVEEGTITLAVEGQPTKTLKAGDVFTISPGLIHEGSNKGNTTARLSVVFVAEKGKPLTTKVE